MSPTDATHPRLNPHDLQSLLFCPRTLWWRHVAGLKPAPTAAMRAGASLHQRVQEMSTADLNAAFGLDAVRYVAEVPAKDERWSGRADLVAHTPSGWVPIELKLTDKPDLPAHALQLALYAQLLTAQAPAPITRGVLCLCAPPRHASYDPLSTATIKHLSIDLEHYRHITNKIYDQLLALLRSEPFPDADLPIERCELCPHVPFCHDRTPWRDALDEEDDIPADLHPSLIALLSSNQSKRFI